MAEKKAKSPYRRHNKVEIDYSGVPLHRKHQGKAPTVENIATWEHSLWERYGDRFVACKQRRRAA